MVPVLWFQLFNKILLLFLHFGFSGNSKNCCFRGCIWEDIQHYQRGRRFRWRCCCAGDYLWTFVHVGQLITLPIFWLIWKLDWPSLKWTVILLLIFSFVTFGFLSYLKECGLFNVWINCYSVRPFTLYKCCLFSATI